MRQSWVTLAMAMVAATIFATTASAIDSPQTLTLLEVSLPKNDRPLGAFPSIDRPRPGTDSPPRTPCTD
jgi:hypothetical protein